MLKRAVLALVLCAAAHPAFGFALLGPYASWMTPSNGYRQEGQPGGPMIPGEEYRWNLPVITYGFDGEFLAYFGEEGVAAVERAIARLTNLPPASEINLDDYGTRSVLVNQEAQALGLFDVNRSRCSG